MIDAAQDAGQGKSAVTASDGSNALDSPDWENATTSAPQSQPISTALSPAEISLSLTAAAGNSQTASVASTAAHASASSGTSPVTADSSSATLSRQVTAPLIALGGSRGNQNLTIQLEPNELGKVQIRIEKDADSAHISLTADRPQTLSMLMSDQTQLHHALDQAGLPSEGRSVTFHLASSTTSLSTGTGGASTGGSDWAGGGGSGGRQGGAQRGQSQNNSSSEAGVSSENQEVARWLRVGVDITA